MAKIQVFRDFCFEVNIKKFSVFLLNTAEKVHFPLLKIVEGLKPLTIFTKGSIIDMWKGLKYAFENFHNISFTIHKPTFLNLFKIVFCV